MGLLLPYLGSKLAGLRQEPAATARKIFQGTVVTLSIAITAGAFWGRHVANTYEDGKPPPYFVDAPGLGGGADVAGTRPSGGGGGGTPEKNRALGKSMAAEIGWTGAEWTALDQLVMSESGWDHKADNPTSTAYGIPQRLMSAHPLTPAEKRADWMNNPRAQISWMFNYIKGRYGTPSAAWSFKQRNNWY